MLAMLAILRSVDAQAPTKKLHRSLKDQLDELDELRDAQVMLVETAHMLEKIPQLAPIQVYEFQMYLEKGEKDLIHKAQIDLGASRPAEVERRFQKLRFAAEGHIRDELLLDKLLASVDEAQAKVARAVQNLDAERPDTIHRVRIAFKSFRYMIETVHPFLQDYPERLLKCMHDYQDAMGSTHDATVLMETIRKFEADLSRRSGAEPSEFDARKIEAYYRKRLDQFVRAYFKRKDEFFTFWRTAPDQPFPWERSHEPVRRTSRNRGTTGHTA
jgi:CHAD domain-containing protein